MTPWRYEIPASGCACTVQKPAISATEFITLASDSGCPDRRIPIVRMMERYNPASAMSHGHPLVSPDRCSIIQE